MNCPYRHHIASCYSPRDFTCPGREWVCKSLFSKHKIHGLVQRRVSLTVRSIGKLKMELVQQSIEPENQSGWTWEKLLNFAIAYLPLCANSIFYPLVKTSPLPPLRTLSLLTHLIPSTHPNTHLIHSWALTACCTFLYDSNYHSMFYIFELIF